MRFTGHCKRATNQPGSDLLFWDHSRLVNGKCNRGNRANFARQLLKKVGAVPGLITSDVELGKLMHDRVEWDRRVKDIVLENSNCN